MQLTPRSRRRPLVASVAILLVAAALAVGLAPPAVAQEPPAEVDGGAEPMSAEQVAAVPWAIPSAWPIGAETWTQILHLAQARADEYGCGLTRDRLAAAMLSIVYYEAGFTETRAPSPMTLGRWDTLAVRPDNASLYAFGDPSTPYQRAYFHAGIGLWQFDSAGHYPLTAAGAIDTWTAAEEASKIVGQRYCASTNPDPVEKVKFAWGPWVACWPLQSTGENRCLTVFNDIFDGTSLRPGRIAPKSDVNHYGGMETRSCSFANRPVMCHFVDPSKAQGYDDWAVPSYGGSATAPISAPFYVISHEGNEHRFWLAEDTGYPKTITASKPITADARNALKWSFTDQLCDETTQRGWCGNPFGYFDQLVAGPASVRVRGWAIDPNTAGPIYVHAYVGDHFYGQWLANVPRPDVAVAFPGFGSNHGYHVTLNGVEAGTREVCLYAINIGSGSVNQHLGCKTVVVPPGPAGFWDVPPGHPFGSEISWVAEVGVADGYSDKRFRPKSPVTRQAMAAFVWRTYALMGGAPEEAAPTFTDVPADHPFAAAIGWMAAEGISTGFGDNTFRPGEPVTRQAAAAFLKRFHDL